MLPKISIGPRSSSNVKISKRPFTKPEPNQSPILVQSVPQFWNHPISPPPDSNLKTSLASFATSKSTGRLRGKLVIVKIPISIHSFYAARQQRQQQQQPEEDDEDKTSNNDYVNHTVIAAELAPDQQQLVANYEEAQADRDNLQRRLEEIEQQRHTVVADAVIVKDDERQTDDGSGKSMALLVLCVLVIIGIIVGAVVGTRERDAETPTPSPTTSQMPPPPTLPTFFPTQSPTPTTSSGPTLQYVKEKGNIRCRAESFEVGHGFGFSLDLVSTLYYQLYFHVHGSITTCF